MIQRYAVEVKRGDTWERIEGKTLGAHSDEEAQEQAQRRFRKESPESVRAVRYQKGA